MLNLRKIIIFISFFLFPFFLNAENFYEEIYEVQKKGEFLASFSNIHGTIKSFKLLNQQYRQKEKHFYPDVPEEKYKEGPMDMISTWDPEYYPFQITFETFEFQGKIKRKIKSNSSHNIVEGDFFEIYKKDPVYSIVEKTPKSITFVWPDPQWDESDVFIEKHYEIEGKYRLNGTIKIYNFSPYEVREQLLLNIYAWQPPDIKGGGLFSPAVDIYNGIVFTGEDVERKSPDKIITRQTLRGRCKWGGIDSRYFLLSAVPLNLTNVQCSLQSYKNGVIEAKFHETQPNRIDAPQKTCIPLWLKNKRKDLPSCKTLREFLGVKDDASFNSLKNAFKKKKFSLSENEVPMLEDAYERLVGQRGIQYKWIFYLGPKDIGILKDVDAQLDESIDFWILGFLCKPMLFLLRIFYDFIPLWSIAIALLTLVVKLITLYWTEKGYRQMEKMQKLKPLMDEIREKYKNDKQRLNQEMLNLYKREKVNPLGGCLPMLFQMPIWIALYRTIYSSVDLYQAPLFGWIKDLSAPDPYFVLPLLLGILMFIQQKMTPTGADTSQAKIMLYIMPVMFTVFMLFLPSGLTYYILVSTILGIIHQWITKMRGRKKLT